MGVFVAKIEFASDSIIEAVEIISKAKVDKKFTISYVEEIVPPLQNIEYKAQELIDNG